jgi:hypothetical protein
MTTPKTPARLDADRTAQPLTRIVHHPPRGGCISPHMPLVAPEYEDEHGKRTPLTSEPKAHDLTQSEVALAKMLAAWEEWPGDLDHHRETLLVIGAALEKHALIAEGQPSEDGRALLDRARRAGVL